MFGKGDPIAARADKQMDGWLKSHLVNLAIHKNMVAFSPAIHGACLQLCFLFFDSA